MRRIRMEEYGEFEKSELRPGNLTVEMLEMRSYLVPWKMLRHYSKNCG